MTLRRGDTIYRLCGKSQPTFEIFRIVIRKKKELMDQTHKFKPREVHQEKMPRDGAGSKVIINNATRSNTLGKPLHHVTRIILVTHFIHDR